MLLLYLYVLNVVIRGIDKCKIMPYNVDKQNKETTTPSF